MDIFGSAGSIAAHEAATETFANPGETNRPELCERYLWALAQIRSPESTIVQGFKFKNCNRINGQCKQIRIRRIS